MMVRCSMDRIKELEAERDDWAHIAKALYQNLVFMEQKVVIAEELVRAMRELQQAAQGALSIGDKS